MFSFLSPAFLFGALVAVLPIALHLAGRRPEPRVEFPSVRLLKRAPAAAARRRRLRELVLLALRVAGVFLLAVAFARPYLAQARPDAPPPPTTVVALDRSFSMSAPGQFAEAIRLAGREVSSLPSGTRVGLIAFDDRADMLVAPTGDRGRVLAALNGLQPGFGGTSYGAALARAADIIGTAPGRIVVVTDLERNGWRDEVALPPSVQVSVVDAGAPAGNLSVTDLRRLDAGLTAAVRNHGAVRRTGKATWSIDGRVTRVLPWVVDGGATVTLTYPGPLPATGEAAVTLDDAIGYAADNTAYAWLDPPAPAALLAITGQGEPAHRALYLERALGVDGASLFRLETEAGAQVSVRAPEQTLRRYQAVLVLGTDGLTSPALAALAKYVEAGGGLLVALDDRVSAAALNGLLPAFGTVRFESPGLAERDGLLVADGRHPVFAPLGPAGFGQVSVSRVARFTAPADAAVLARFADGRPALVESRRGAGRVLLFASDLGNQWNDLPLQPAFLPFVHELARYLVGNRLPARDVLVASVPRGMAPRPGFAALPVADIEGRPAAQGRIVVNVDPRESVLDRMTPVEFAQMVARVRVGAPAPRGTDQAEHEQRQAWWRMALAAAIAILLVESLVGRVRDVWV